MHTDTPAYGLWSLVVINSAVFRNYSKDTGLLQAARASCKVWRVW